MNTKLLFAFLVALSVACFTEAADTSQTDEAPQAEENTQEVDESPAEEVAQESTRSTTEGDKDSEREKCREKCRSEYEECSKEIYSDNEYEKCTRKKSNCLLKCGDSKLNARSIYTKAVQKE